MVDLDFQPIQRGKVTFTIVASGELDAVKSTQLNGKVRNKKDNWFGTTIKWLVEDGAQVKKGDVLVRMEDSALKEQLQTQLITVTEKRALLIEAEREMEMISSQNQIAIKTAQNNATIARINLKKYLEGDLEQKRKDVQGRITLARAEVRQWEDRVAWSARMVKRGFVSDTQAEADENKLQSARINLAKVVEEERVLEHYDSEVTQLDLTSKLEQADVALKVAQTEAEGKAAKAEASLRARSIVLEQEETRFRDIAEDIHNCTIPAPHDGMVLYYIPEQSRSGAGSQKGILAVGEPVYEGKNLMSIPDLRRMKVRVKVHESVQSRVRGDQTRKTGQGAALYAGLALSHSGWDLLATLLAAPEVRRVAAGEGLLQEEIVVRPGQAAQIRVSSLDRLLTGRVTSVATAASQLDSISSDVRVYPTLVAIQDADEPLRPGMSAEVTIFVDERDNVLRLPVNAVLEVAGEKFCYVKTPAGEVQKRVLETGLNNSRFIEIKSGLAEGELVLQNPRGLAEKRGDLNTQGTDPGERAPRRAEPARSPAAP